MKKNIKQYQQGYFIAMCIVITITIFTTLGKIIGYFIDNSGLIYVGTTTGIIIGSLIGLLLERKYSKEGKIRPAKLTGYENWLIKTTIIAGIILIIVIMFYFIKIFL